MSTALARCLSKRSKRLLPLPRKTFFRHNLVVAASSIPSRFRDSLADVHHTAHGKQGRNAFGEKRTVFTYVSDVLRTGTLSPPNPILDYLEESFATDADNPLSQSKGVALLALPSPNEEEEEETTQSRVVQRKIQLPQLAYTRAHHFEAAVQAVDRENNRIALEILQFPSSLSKDKDAPEALSELMSKFGQLKRNWACFSQMGLIMINLSCDLDKVGRAAFEEALAKYELGKYQWHHLAGSSVTSDTDKDEENDNSKFYEVLVCLQELLNAVEGTPNSRTNQDVVLAAKQVIRELQQNFFLLETTDGEGSTHDDMRKQYMSLQEALPLVESTILSLPSLLVSKSVLTATYSYLGIKYRQAELLGYSSIAEMAMGSNALDSSALADELKTLSPTVKQARELQEEVARNAVLAIRRQKKVTLRSKEERELDEYLTGNAAVQKFQMENTPQGSIQQQNIIDNKIRIRLKQHATLDGAMKLLSDMALEMLGLRVVEETDNSKLEKMGIAWFKRMRIFHVYDQQNADKYLGSFLLDACLRHGKVQGGLASIASFTNNVLVNTDDDGLQVVDRKPLVCVKLDIDGPLFNDEPVKLTWVEVESLFHEIGHAYQLILYGQRPDVASLLNPGDRNASLPAFDTTVIFSKFMELWTSEKSTIYALIAASETDVPFLDESIDAAFRIRSQTKALEIAQEAFYGALELELFSDPTVLQTKKREEETGGDNRENTWSVVALQQELARRMIPHDVPVANDMTPTVDILCSNIRGDEVCRYKYMWGHALAAQMIDRFLESVQSADGSANPQGGAATETELRNGLRSLLCEPWKVFHKDQGGKSVAKILGIDKCGPSALMKRYGLLEE